MPRWKVILFVPLLSLAAACAQGPIVTSTPASIASPAPATAVKAPAEAPKPTAAPSAAATVGATVAVKPLSPTVTVKIGSDGSFGTSFLYIAGAKGYFADEGLEADFVPFTNTPAMTAPLSTGELDVGGGGPSAALFSAMARGIPSKIVADRNTSIPGGATMAFMVRKDVWDSGQIKDFKDLKGKTIAISGIGTSTHMFLEKALEKGGLTPQDVNEVVLSFPNMVAAFSTKAIEVAVGTEPTNARTMDQGTAVRWKAEDEVYPNHEPSILLYGAKFSQDKPEAAKRFMVAYVRAIRDYLDAFTKNINKDQIISILTKNTDAKDPALFGKMPILGVNPDGYVDPKSISADQDWYFAKGLIQQKVDLSKVIDNQYVDYAIQRLGKYRP